MSLTDIQDSLTNPAHTARTSIKSEKPKIRTPILTQFFRFTKNYALFNFFFWFLIAVEVIIFVLFFTFLVKSAVLAVNVAIIFATFFAYFILRLQRQTQKQEKFEEICDLFVEEFARHSPHHADQPEYHIELANGFARMASTLQGKEYKYYPAPKLLKFLSPILAKFSFWWHWHDVYKMKECLLLRSVKEYIDLVKQEPTDLELHAALANAYVMLSGLYHHPSSWDHEAAQIFKEKFTRASKRAIEEFKILNEYAPNDPWIHQQLAYSYHDLQMPEEEIKEYEILLSLLPSEDEILYKLGTLYFQQGETAKGLSIYEKLKNIDPGKAEALIQHYGDAESSELS
jgi:tetratricopeptide (TPR) repeat protein